MDLTQQELADALEASSLVRAELREVESILARHASFPPFDEWARTTHEAVDALELGLRGGTPATTATWYHPALSARIRALLDFGIADARLVLAHFRRAETATDELAEILDRRRQERMPALVLVGNVIVAFVMFELALDALFPELGLA